MKTYVVEVTRVTTYSVLAETQDEALDEVLLAGEGTEVYQETVNAVATVETDHDAEAPSSEPMN